MKSKYKLKIKEISMRLKSSLFLLLGVVCLLALGQMVQASTWTDPTCAAPGCNTNGPVWISPDTTQTGYVDLTGYVKTVITDDNKNYFNAPVTSTSQQPVLDIFDQRTSSITGAASLYVRTVLDGKPAIYGSSTGSSATSYGGYFSAAAAPGLYVTSGVVVEPLASNPTYVAEGLLYLNSSTNQFRYYGDSAWRILNPFVTADADADGVHELYYSVAAGTQRGVAIKSGDLTGPNDNYTLDVVRESQSTSDRALYSRLTISPSWDYYASGFIGGYDDSGNAIGVRGKVSAHMGGLMLNYGGYFEAAGGTGSAGVYGLASAGGASKNYGGYFQANGSSGIGVYATGPSSGVYAIGGTVGVDAEGDTAVYGYGQSYGAQFWTDSAVIDGAIGVFAISQSSTNGVGLYAEGNHAVHGNSGFSNGRGVYGQHGSAAVGYGGYFTSSGSSGVGVYAAGPSTPTATAYAAKFDNGAIAMEELGTVPTWDTNYGMLYVKSDGKLWFTDSATGASYDLTASAGASGNIADGTVTGQVTYWNNTAGEWQSVASTDMLWDNTNKNLGIGVSPTAANKLHVVNNSSTHGSTAVYGESSDTAGKVYGGYFVSKGNEQNDMFGVGVSVGVIGKADNISATVSTIGGAFSSNSSTGIGVLGEGPYIGVEGRGGWYEEGVKSYGGYFSAEGTDGVGVYADAGATGAATNYGGYFKSSGDSGIGVYGEAPATGYAGDFSGRVRTSSYFGSSALGSVSAATYSWIGDENTGVFSPAADIFAITTAGSERMRVDSAGNVGVGVTATSTNKLHVVNSGTTAASTAVYGNASGTTGAVYGGYFTASGAGNTGAGLYAKSFSTGDNSYGIYGETLSTSAAIYGNNVRTTAATGGVGVEGVSSAPDGGIGVFGRATNTGAGVVIGGEFRSAGSVGVGVYGYASHATGVNYGGYFMTNSASGYAGYFYGRVYTNSKYLAPSADTAAAPGFTWDGDENTGIFHSAADTLNFSTNGTERMEINSTGLVGINTAPTTGYTLHVETSSATSTYGAIRGESTSASYGVYGISSTGRGVRGFASSTGAVTNYGGSFEADGTTGIGVYATGPGYAGYFEGKVYSTQKFITYGSDSVSAPGYSWYGDEDTGIYRSAADTIAVTTGGSQSMTISSTGLVTLTGSSATSLIVDNGRIRNLYGYNNTISGTANLYIDSTGRIGRASSSIRYKDNITNINDVSWLYELRPVNFTYKNDESKTNNYGFIAEEVENVNKNIVFYNKEGLVEGVEYTMLITPTIKAIQTQKQQLDALETKVEKMESKGCANTDAELMEYIKKLEARVEALEAEKTEPVKTSFWSKLW